MVSLQDILKDRVEMEIHSSEISSGFTAMLRQTYTCYEVIKDLIKGVKASLGDEGLISGGTKLNIVFITDEIEMVVYLVVLVDVSESVRGTRWIEYYLAISSGQIWTKVTFLFDELRDRVVNDIVTQLKVLTSFLDDGRGTVEFVNREVKSLKRNMIALVKVHWDSKRGPEFTWKRKDRMWFKCHQLFIDSANASSS
ncbi:hypothetical protein Tco_0724995 [Tanacetum coccineum]|uniref:Uncharacterized protein n=1 Tax=Tanacetum coccineum TaxID=301880 RepID=A0ABQ4YBL7_9ASTR